MSENFNLHKQSELVDFTVLRMNCEKLAAPPEGSKIKATLSMGIGFDGEKKGDGYEITYDIGIKCQDTKEKDLYTVEYKAGAFYKFDYEGDEISTAFENAYNNFLRELYTLSIDFMNYTMFKMKINFALPPRLPAGIKKQERDQID